MPSSACKKKTSLLRKAVARRIGNARIREPLGAQVAVVALSASAALFPYTTLFRSSRRMRRASLTGSDFACDPSGMIFSNMFKKIMPRGSQAKSDRKSTRLNSSHVEISYAVFCLQKKNVAPTKGGSASDRKRTHPRTLGRASRSRRTVRKRCTLSLHDALPIFQENAAGVLDRQRLRLRPARHDLLEHVQEVHAARVAGEVRSEEHTSELQSRRDLVCRLLLAKKKRRSYERR